GTLSTPALVRLHGPLVLALLRRGQRSAEVFDRRADLGERLVRERMTGVDDLIPVVRTNEVLEDARITVLGEIRCAEPGVERELLAKNGEDPIVVDLEGCEDRGKAVATLAV